MKKIYLVLTILSMTVLAVHAQDIVTLQNTQLRVGGSEKAVVMLTTDIENYRGFQTDVVLPIGITVTGITDAGRGVESENVDVNKRFGKAEPIEVEGNAMQKQTVVFAISCNFRTGEGELLRLTLAADESVSAGTYTGYLKNVLLSYSTGSTVPVAESSFTIEVYEGNVRVTLDENSTTAPEASTEPVDVRVLRTIKANDWSTICLPFAMTEAQVKTAFGDDVQLADFTSWSSEEDGEGNIVGIQVGFTSITEMEANHPCLIKVSNPVTEFTADNVDIVVEEEPTVEVGKRRVEKGFLTGTYVANTVVPENNLFLSGNKFYYSKGLTKMKAYRAYFEFYDVLTAVEEASAKIRFSIDNEATCIEGLTGKQMLDGVYTVQGQFLGNGVELERLPKGVYIVNGKKVVKP